MPSFSNYSSFLSLGIEQEVPNHQVCRVKHWGPPTLILGGSSEHPRYLCYEQFCSGRLRADRQGETLQDPDATLGGLHVPPLLV